MGRHRKFSLDFFVHDCHASGDRKIRFISRRHGNDGYATFFRLLEMLCQEDGIRLRIGTDFEAEVIAEDCCLRDSAHLYKIVQDCVECGLFDKQLWESERTIFSHGLYRRYEARLEERRSAAERMKRKREADSLAQRIKEVEDLMFSETENCSGEQSGTFSNNPTEYRDQNTENRIQNSDLKNQNLKPEGGGGEQRASARPISRWDEYMEVYNREKPEAWASITTINNKRRKYLEVLEGDLKSSAAAIAAFRNALAYARQAEWWSSKDLTFDNLCTNNKILQWHERFLALDKHLSPEDALSRIEQELRRLGLTAQISGEWYERTGARLVDELSDRDAREYLAYLQSLEVAL